MKVNKKNNVMQQCLHGCRYAFLMVGIFSFFANLLILSIPIYAMQLFDKVLASHGYNTLIFLTIIVLIALLAFALLDIVRSRLLILLGSWFDKQISKPAFEKSIDDSIQGHEYSAQSLADIHLLRNVLSNPVLYVLFDIPWAPMFVAIIFILSPLLGIITIIAAILLISIAWINQKCNKEKLAKSQKDRVNAQGFTVNSFRNAESMQAMGMFPNVFKHWQHYHDNANNMELQASKVSVFYLGITKFLRMSFQVIILGTGAILVLQDELTAGGMITASILLTRALAPIEQASVAWQNFLLATRAFKRLKQYFDQGSSREPCQLQQQIKGYLQVKQVFFHPENREDPILQNITFDLLPGESLGIIGPSASGKTTLARLIMGIIEPSKGLIRLDDIDVFTSDRFAFGSQVGYLSQNLEVFDGTIGENIARMQENCDDAVIAASKIAGVHELIQKLPKGYNTPLQHGNHVLSGGQLQGIAIARALYGDPKFIIFDEPSKNLDQLSQKNLLDIFKYCQKKLNTIIVISHQMPVINQMNKVLYLNNGIARLYGPPEQVMQVLSSSGHVKITKDTSS